MAEVQIGQLTIVVVPKEPTRSWSYPTNEYYEKETGDLLDPDSMPASAKGHSYKVYAITNPAGEYLLIKNVLRAWDEESIPLIEEFDGRPYNPRTNEVDQSKIVHPSKYEYPTAVIPLMRHQAFVKRAEAAEWEIVDLTWKTHGLEDVQRLLEAVESGKIPPKDGMLLLEHYWEVHTNLKDPYLSKDAKAQRELRVLLAKVQAAIQARAPELEISDVDNLEAVLHQMRTVFPWADRAELSAGTITIPLGKGTLSLSPFGVEYQESGKVDGLIAKKGGRLDNILNGAL